MRVTLIGGRKVAEIRDQDAGGIVRVYHRLGKWRRYADDSPAGDPALAATARRAIAGMEPEHEPYRRPDTAAGHVKRGRSQTP